MLHDWDQSNQYLNQYGLNCPSKLQEMRALETSLESRAT